MRHDKKPAGWLAYQHYLMTGTIWGFYEGAVQRGPGTLPSDPVDFETFPTPGWNHSRGNGRSPSRPASRRPRPIAMPT